MENKTFYVSPNGNDSWSGTLSEAGEKDGPFLTIKKARNTIRELKKSGALCGPVRVLLRGGHYPIKEPITMDGSDSWYTTYEAYGDEKPVISGGKAITDWQIEQHNGITMWATYLPDVEYGRWYFRQLFANGVRLARTRYPSHGFCTVKMALRSGLANPKHAIIFDGAGSFVFHEGEIQNWDNITDAEIVVHHLWVDEHMPIQSVDMERNIVVSDLKSMFIIDNPRWQTNYYVENIFEALQEPGQWYLNRKTGMLYYVPREGETFENTQFTAPCILQLIKIRGDANEYVEHLHFKGIHFMYSDWDSVAYKGDDDFTDILGLDGIEGYAASPQGAVHLPGCISLEGAAHCTFEGCTVAHTGFHAISIGEACKFIRVIKSDIYDAGAGGIIIGGSNAKGDPLRRTGNITITDNHIHQCGNVYKCGIGVLITHANRNTVAHNHIHHLHYSGISCGWVWGFEDSVSKDNIIEYNHIHHIGYEGHLSDMGGIYTLGVSPGTVLRGNIIHDVKKLQYGGFGIYLDEGSSHIIIEDNICYHIESNAFHQHYGRENVVRNNIFACGEDGTIRLSRSKGFCSFTLMNNILITAGKPIIENKAIEDFDGTHIISDLNILWDTQGEEPVVSCNVMKENVQCTLKMWQELGYDRHSIIAKPNFKNMEEGDFSFEGSIDELFDSFRPISAFKAGIRE